jgi:hypothetical protein
MFACLKIQNFGNQTLFGVSKQKLMWQNKQTNYGIFCHMKILESVCFILFYSTKTINTQNLLQQMFPWHVQLADSK